MKITSLQNSQVKEVVRLREGRHRRDEGRFLIDGRREIERAVKSGFQFERVFYSEESCDEQLWSALTSSQAELIEVTGPIMEKIGFGNRDEGAVAVAYRPERTLEGLKLSSAPLIGVAEGIEKPGNLGALLRSADGAGIEALILADCKTDVYNPNAVRASLGTIFSIPVIETDSDTAIKWLIDRQIRIFATRVDGAILYTEADYRSASALVFGAEAVGLTDAWNGPAIQPIYLPMNGIADSLNISATAAICFYEAVRQRTA